mgnify:CR=1 FL=1
MLSIESLTLSLGGEKILADVGLDIEAGDLVILLGPNGAGKSTLLRTVLGLHRVTAGSLRWQGHPLDGMASVLRAAHMSWLPQHGAVSEPLAVLELVTAARFRFQESRAHAESSALDALTQLQMASFAQRTLDTLSGGETQKVALAALLAQDATMFLLDEPGNHLDPRHQFELYQWIGKQWRAGRTLLCTTHDIGLLGHLGSSEGLERVRVVGMKEGAIVFDTTYGDAAIAQHLEQLFAVPFFSVQVGNHVQWVAGVPGGERS